jgi:uncharacterized membrane protein YphA (DoxX/SURF4 family)
VHWREQYQVGRIKELVMNTLRSKAPAVARIVLGLAFFVFGLNGFLQFMPMPPHPEKAGAFLGALAATGYMFPLIKGTEVIAGALLLSGRFTPLALLLLAPILVNIVGFHAALAPDGVGLPVVLVALEAYLAWAYRSSFRGVLAAKATPATAGAEPEHALAHAAE